MELEFKSVSKIFQFQLSAIQLLRLNWMISFINFYYNLAKCRNKYHRMPTLRECESDFLYSYYLQQISKTKKYPKSISTSLISNFLYINLFNNKLYTKKFKYNATSINTSEPIRSNQFLRVHRLLLKISLSCLIGRRVNQQRGFV